MKSKLYSENIGQKLLKVKIWMMGSKKWCFEFCKPVIHPQVDTHKGNGITTVIYDLINKKTSFSLFEESFDCQFWIQTRPDVIEESQYAN